MTVKEIKDLLPLKLALNEDGTFLKTGKTPVSSSPSEIEYPFWLKGIFTLMTATYGNLWTNQFIDDETTEVIKRVWFFQLKEFPVQMIRRGILEAGKIYSTPPKPSQLIEILKMVERIERDRLKFEEKRISLPRSQKTDRVDTVEVLEAKRSMWLRLKRFDKVKVIDETLAAMDMQKK